MASDYIDRVEELVINGETNDSRFERFCNAVVSHAEGDIPIVGTSTTWDLGRDGVGMGRGSGIYVCTSLRDDVDIKAITDVERITETTNRITRLYFCSSQNLTEHRIEKIRAALSAQVENKFPILVLGAQQLAEIGREEGKALDRHYGAEIRNVLSRIDRSTDDQSELLGLRLALFSSGAEQSAEIRTAIYSSVVLDLLHDREGRSLSRLCKDVAEHLKLSRSLDGATMLPYLQDLAKDGLIEVSLGVYKISDSGLDKIEQQKIAGASSLIEGRNSIREALESAIGSKIIDDEFSRIWDVFEDRMAEYFQLRGETIVAEITAFIDGDGDDQIETTSSSLSFLEEFAAAVAATSAHAQRRSELNQAVKDLFADRTGEAAQWLVRICAAFVAACTMGLEHKSSQAISSLLKRTSVALDTDVVLSLLGEAEPDHEAVSLIVEKWTRLGGSVLVGTPVLEEAAYHAFIAQRDFEQVQSWLPGTAQQRVHLIENVFVRAFAYLLAEKRAFRNQWPQYISQFRGRSEYDYGALYAHLQHEHSINRLPDRDADDATLAAKVKAHIIESMERQSFRVDKNARDKATRDAELYVALAKHARRLRTTDPGSACILLSSAKRLSAVDDTFHESGEAKLVVSISAALYLVSLLPSVSLGLSAMRSFLFDESKGRFSSELERTLLRMIHSSKERSLPFAKRGILMREVRGRLLENASYREAGAPKLTLEQVERNALRTENRENLIEALSESLDAVAVDTRTERELRNLRQQVEDLKRQLERKSRGR